VNQLKTKIYDDVFKRILQGDFQANSLIKENDLIDYYGVSRAPVREALLMLCTEGVLESIPRAGYHIIQISEKQEREIMQFRALLECGSLKANWRNVTDSVVEKLLLADSNRFLSSPSPFSSFWQASINFHTTLISIGNNNYAVESLRTAMKTQYRAFAQYIWNFQNRSNLPDSDLGHKSLIDSIAKRNLSQSLALLEQDIMNFRIYDKFI
jgi:DNA-binding GntR family transcriptional regulator